MRLLPSICVLLAATICCIGCTPASAVREDVPDRFERLNRGVYKFNRGVDRKVVRPIARGYDRVMPVPVDRHMRNFFSNLTAPLNVLHNFLQAKFKPGFSDLGRFLLNTAAGAGFFDPAAKLGLEPHPEDFGQTLAVWGVPSGGPLMLPLLGMGTIRDWGGYTLDVHGDVSALTNCGGFPEVFSGGELNRLGLLSDLSRAKDVRRELRSACPREPHAECDVWALWRLRSPDAMVEEVR
jgi:phospholipid-binding lipoprotein MlaA